MPVNGPMSVASRPTRIRLASPTASYVAFSTMTRRRCCARNRRRAINDDTIELTNRARITVATNNRRSPRGRTICAAIFDETGFWYNENYANPDFEVDAAVTPGLARFPGPAMAFFWMDK